MALTQGLYQNEVPGTKGCESERVTRVWSPTQLVPPLNTVLSVVAIVISQLAIWVVVGPQAGVKWIADIVVPVTLWEQVGFQIHPPVVICPIKLTPEVS